MTGWLHLTQINLGFPFLVLVARKFVPWQYSHRRISPSSPSPVRELQSLLNALPTLCVRPRDGMFFGSSRLADLWALATCAAWAVLLQNA